LADEAWPTLAVFRRWPDRLTFQFPDNNGEVNLNLFTSLTGPLGMDSNHLAALFSPVSTRDSLALFDISDASAPILLSRQNFPVNHQNNANSFGQVNRRQ
jgi:hypothetical protein